MNPRYIFCLLLVISLIGVVSADTLLVYSSNDANMYANQHTSWSNLRNHAGSSASDNPTLPYCVNLIAHAAPETDVYTFMYRCGITWNTSTIGGSTIDSTTIRLKYGTKTTTSLGGQNELAVVVGSPANPLDYVAGDYDALNLSSPTELASRFNFTSTTTGNLNYTLNSNGLAAINKTGNTVFYFLDGDELDNSFSGTWVTAGTRIVRVYGTSDATQANRPYLLITYTTGGTPPVASFTLNKNFIRIPNSVTATDTSTNTPTSWEWSWGDGTANSTTQNPSHQYLKRGKWDIVMTATNAGGSSTTSASSVRVYGYEN
jgi:PKD repeat protein